MMTAPLEFPALVRNKRGTGYTPTSQKEYVKFWREIQDLFAFFGFRLLSGDPGANLIKGNGKHFSSRDVITIDQPAFRDIVPLLYELRVRREREKASQKPRRGRRVAR